MTRDETDIALIEALRQIERGWSVLDEDQRPLGAAAVDVYHKVGRELTYAQVRNDLIRLAAAGLVLQSRDDDPQHRVAKLAGWRWVYSLPKEVA